MNSYENSFAPIELKRKTSETDIYVRLGAKDAFESSISTGVAFFDHMLNSFAKHSGFSLEVMCKGDISVDCHHTVEDCGIVIGRAIAELLGDRSGIVRYGSALIPMDESLALCAVDISGRPFLVFDADFRQERCGAYDCCMTEEFFRALAFNAGITLHLKVICGSNSHHETEALFKAFAHAFSDAVKRSGGGTLSTKGVL